MLLHPSIRFLHGRGGFKEVICLDEDVVDELVVDEAGDPERIVSVDTSELVDDLDVSTGKMTLPYA